MILTQILKILTINYFPFTNQIPKAFLDNLKDKANNKKDKKLLIHGHALYSLCCYLWRLTFLCT